MPDKIPKLVENHDFIIYVLGLAGSLIAVLVGVIISLVGRIVKNFEFTQGEKWKDFEDWKSDKIKEICESKKKLENQIKIIELDVDMWNKNMIGFRKDFKFMQEKIIKISEELEKFSEDINKLKYKEK